MRLFILALLVAASLAGCTDDPATSDDKDDPDDDAHAGHNMGGSDGAGNETPVHAVTITFTGTFPASIMYDKSSVTVPANTTVELTFKNGDNGNNPFGSHDLVIEGIEGAGTKVIAGGQEETITFDSGAAKSTKFYCSVGDHRSRGMEGDFIVE